jgi:hypothetical protein
MKNKDPGEKGQKALPVCIYREIYKQANSSQATIQDKTIAWLQILAFFFCMRSCEYSDVQGERRKKLFVLGTSDFSQRTNSSQMTHQKSFQPRPYLLHSNGRNEMSETTS